MWSKSQNLLALLALSSFVQAGWFEDRLNEVVRRQADANESDTASVSTPVVTPTPPEETISSTPTTPTPSPTPTTTPQVTPSTTPVVSTTPTPSATPSASTTPPQTTSTPPSTISSTVAPDKATSSTTTVPKVQSTTTAKVTPSVSVIRQTVYQTVDGSTITSVSESTSTMQPSSTGSAGLADGSESSGGGLTSKTKGTVIGVVVGIGGAILLAGLAVVAWRIWGRKKNADEGDDLMDYSRPDTGAEKTSMGGSSSNPFQSTLENYHNPAKQVNASSNF